ncbi:hypothetical protein CLV78_102419 [Aliiruegeria haliotis]|uniref:Type IV pilus biogenesis protein PilP n=1 Tax=Aliiruegeria haliotis TaxID=1280846 RepID=A0A2T0RVT6_9RHOB|nr:hypothetical protein [Aliiruegeria haliotis]PRY25242.1 hypothetical protein CLV78_102419 [Aliiruegeria haliotis]
MAEKATTGSKRAGAIATTKKGIELDELALIGVFGTDTKRRALVRHASGRVQKIAMGGRLSGGKVVAIGKDEVFIRFGSRTQKLEMPG